MTPPRREFLKSTRPPPPRCYRHMSGLQADSPQNSVLRIGFIGCGGMGMNHLNLLSKRNDVQVIRVCDVDADRLAAAEKTVAGRLWKITDRPREISEKFLRIRQWTRSSLQHLIIGTLRPRFWRLDAGKHVYVEKPCCHNIREGRLLAQAVERSGKRLQVGTQSRSTQCVKAGIDRIRNGEIGEILVSKAWNSQRRG